eukprot:CAMPEP_0202972016 /NCGR_PEP_ID=MMETSP1396-20130829/32629_1 /ASSEMBLY_ACC=CAM_ASM_000872 /TAXON_ID= /ORGANISM="Pseudokeronopsis sp., Strain Brazil" /LENGTH=38 /DNA_ID= /DNA_START= /DNA_END= /DNA_ORIENTATION=
MEEEVEVEQVDIQTEHKDSELFSQDERKESELIEHSDL